MVEFNVLNVLLPLLRIASKTLTVPRDGYAYMDELRTIWRNGDLQYDSAFADIRERANNAALVEAGLK